MTVMIRDPSQIWPFYLFGAIVGAISLFIGAGAGLGPWLGGMIYDWTGSYLEAFWVAQAAGVTSVIFIWLAGSRDHG